MATVEILRVDQVDPDPDQPRKAFDAEKLQELADSIRLIGLTQPITVRRNGDRYLIVAGERRWRAHQIAGLEHVKAIVQDAVEAKALLLQQVSENVARQDMTPLEEAAAFLRLRDDEGMTIQEIGLAVGRRPQDVGWRIDLLDLREDERYLLESGRMSVNLAWYVSRCNQANQQAIIRRWMSGELASETEAMNYAKGVKVSEDQGDLFAGDDAMSAEAVERRAQAARKMKEVARDIDSMLDKVHTLLTMKDADLIGALGADAAKAREKVADLKNRLTRLVTRLDELKGRHVA